MKKLVLIVSVVALATISQGQSSYKDSIQAYLDDYISNHEVVTGDNRKLIQFFPADPAYRVKAKFEKAKNPGWFLMETSGTEKKRYRVYGTVSFTLNGQPVSLNLYQSQSLLEEPEYRDYLLLPFTDGTSGKETYQGGRYLDFTMGDIKNGILVVDFNKAYNPYCAYESDKYNCPLPPKENRLSVPIYAGEKIYSKKQ